MSDQGRAYVWAYSPYKGVAFTIHLALGDLANDVHHHRLWMSAKTLAWKTRTTRQTATTLLSKMVDDGFLERLSEPEVRNGRPVEYRFLMPEVAIQFAPMLEGGVSRADTGVSAELTTGVGRADTEPKKNQTTPTDTSQFEEFFTIFPTARKGSRREVRKAWDKAIKRADPAEILAGAVRYRDDPNRVDAWTKGGARWLNADGWEEGPIPAEPSSNGHRKDPPQETRNYDVDRIWAKIAEEEGVDA